MGPKKAKDTTLDENYWRTCIIDAVLNEETWNAKVILMEAAGGDQDRIYLNKFEIFAAEERRFVVKNICKTETIFMVNQLGGEKKVKDDNLRVFEEGQAFLKDKKDIPPDVLALIIKHLILKMKDEYLYIKRQKLEVREGMRRESATMVSRAEIKGTVNASLPEETNLPAPLPKEKNKKHEIEPLQEIPELSEGKKYNTLLRVRGEEWRDKTYVDDFPIEGPNLYVAITGFLQPFLAECLTKIGVPLTAVVQIRIHPTEVRVPSSLFTTSKRGQSQTDVQIAKCQKFWEDLQQLRIHKNSCDYYNNTAFIVFSPPYCETEDLSGNPEKIYDELCYLMYDIQDLSRQHLHYLENMDVINIPEEREDERINNIYNQHISELPLESLTIYSILDSILQAVSHLQQLNEKSSNTSLSTSSDLNQTRISATDENRFQKAENLVKNVFNTLCYADSTKKRYRITYGEEYENHKDPIVVNYGDFAKYKNFHLGNINMDNIVWSMLHGIPIFRLWRNRDQRSGELEAKVNFHVNVLLSCFERKDVETTELNRLIHILACRKMYNNRSSLKVPHLLPSTITEFKKVYLKRSVLAEPLSLYSPLYRSWNSISPPFASLIENDNNSDIDRSSENYRIKFLFDCPDISELLSAAEIASEKHIGHIVDDFEFFEEYPHVCGSQRLLNAFNKFNCVDYKYCEVTDSLILLFFNSHDKEGVAREEWRCHLPTPLCLQDFFDFVLDEQYEWIKKEEQIYAENMIQKSQSENKSGFDIFAERTCIENTEVNMDLIMEGSLKYQDIVNLEEAVPEETESKTKTSMSSPTDGGTKSSRRTKSAISTPKPLKQTFVPGDSSPINIPKKQFSGYNLSDRRVEIFGKDSCFFSDDGTSISTKYTIMIPGNSEYITLKMAPGNNNTEFWNCKALGDINSELSDTCESFRISTKNNLLIYVKKQTFIASVPTLDPSCTERLTEKDKSMKDKPALHILNTSKSQIIKNESFHSLLVTWPNGLIIETIYEENCPKISHVKQHYITPLSNLDEDMRCITLNGDVIVFKTSGIIEVLQPNGSYIKITKCEKRIFEDILEDLPHSEASSDKSKKGKGKEKKSSKLSSKSSKAVITDNDDKLSDIKHHMYKLFIDEFEIINANGLKQKYANDLPLEAKKLLTRTATDFCSGEVLSRRMDGTSILLTKNGIQIVTFPDNTRIITTFIIDEQEIYPEWTDEEIEYFTMLDSDIVESGTVKSKSSTSQQSHDRTNKISANVLSTSATSLEEKEADNDEVKNNVRTDGYINVHIIFTTEHMNFSTVSLNKADGTITLTSPNDVSITVNPENNYSFRLDDKTKAIFNGDDLNISYKACLRCQSYTSCVIKIKNDEVPDATHSKYWLTMEDSFNKKISVNNEGNIKVVESFYDETCEEVAHNSENLKSSFVEVKTPICSQKCRELYESKTMQFFILRRELTCSELVHRALVDQYEQNCRWQPWCTINRYHTFGDYRSILSILTPVHRTETEKWLMESQFADKPKYLTYKDLKIDSGKGFYHWMRPYERFQPQDTKPENVVTNTLPRAFILRTLEQQWGDADRQRLKGAAELVTAIFKYRRLMESDSDTILYVPLRDLRTEDERRIDDIIQAIANRTYEDLKYRLEEDIQKRAKATITTKPQIQPEDWTLEGEMEEIPDEMTLKEERQKSLVKEVEAANDMNPNLKRYWRRRAEEYKEEQFYKYLLREGSVPPYFRNVLGGAIWWEINNLTNDASTRAERRKMKCVCEEEDQFEASSHEKDTQPSNTH